MNDSRKTKRHQSIYGEAIERLIEKEKNPILKQELEKEWEHINELYDNVNPTELEQKQVREKLSALTSKLNGVDGILEDWKKAQKRKTGQ
ncbi:MAG: hypothetical protein ACRCUM_03160 [Mycoplasmoidaceae bacterium]